MNRTRQYYVAWETVGEDAVLRVFDVLLDIYEGRVVTAEIDAFTDYRTLPEEAQSAMDRLRALGTERKEQRRRGSLVQRLLSRWGDPWMAIALDLAKPEQLRLLRAFGPYSISCEVYGDDPGDPIISVDDSGISLGFQADPETLAQLTARAGLAPDSIEEVG